VFNPVLIEEKSNSIGQYADDTKASRQITTPRYRVILQSSLYSLCDWVTRHELALSLDKCSYLQVGYSDSAITYTVGSRVLKPSHVVTDLGFVVQSNLKPGLHCTQVATRADARARLILKSFLSRDASCLTRAFNLCATSVRIRYPSVEPAPQARYRLN
jgi:hypothetical protein